MAELLQRGGTAFAVALALAIGDWIAVSRDARRIEYLLKPATMVAVVAAAWSLTKGPHDAWQARFFLPGLALCLAGDVLIMLPGTGFFAGLSTFLLGHACYIAGLTPTLPPALALGFVAAAAVIGGTAYGRIARGLRSRSHQSLPAPVAAYTAVISLMLSAASATILRPD